MKKEDINEEDTFEELEDEVNEEETAEPEEVESDTELEGSGEDQTQTQLDVEEAVEEVENPTEEDKLATEVTNSSLDVLIADEESAIEGYNGFLTQAKNTLLPPLYEVLEKEINEIIKDEEDHINKLNTIKSAFHIEDMPLDESKEIKTEVFDKGNTIFELKLDCSNEDTFDVGEMLSKNVAKELRKVADKLDDTIDQGPIMDINGNKVGSYGFGYEGVMSSLDESKEIKTESVEDKNLANIKACLNQSGIRNPHTVERMAKDVLAILNTYDEDTKDEDGLYYIPAITYAIQDKVERITGKRPELTIESKEIKTENNIPEYVLETARNLFNEINKLDDMHSKTTDIEQGKKYVDKIQELTNRLDQIETQYHFGFLDNGEIKLNEVKTESVTDTEFDDIDSFEDLQNVIEKLYEEEAINDDQYDEISDYISTRKEEVEKYIEERSKVTNTDEKDIVGIMEDNVLDAITRVKEIINGKEIKTEDHQLYYDDIQEMSTEERHKLWMSEHEVDFEDTDEGNNKFWDWAEEEFPMKELNEAKTKSAKDYVYDACKTAWEAGQLDEDLLRYIFEDLEEDNIPYDKEEVTDYFYELLNNREF